MSELKRIVQLVVKAVEDTKVAVKKDIGEFGIEMIRKRTQDGFGVVNGKKRKFKPLAQSTIDRRRKKVLSPDTNPSTSNVTETGQMINSLKSRERKNGVSIRVSGSSVEVAKQVQKTREFLCFTDGEETRLTNFVVKELVKRLKKIC